MEQKQAPKTRTCGKCKEVKDLNADFHKSNDSAHGRHYICKPCRCAYNGPRASEWFRQNRERRKLTHFYYTEKKAIEAAKKKEKTE